VLLLRPVKLASYDLFSRMISHTCLIVPGLTPRPSFWPYALPLPYPGSADDTPDEVPSNPATVAATASVTATEIQRADFDRCHVPVPGEADFILVHID
jgi:hypothetical protein